MIIFNEGAQVAAAVFSGVFSGALGFQWGLSEEGCSENAAECGVRSLKIKKK